METLDKKFIHNKMFKNSGLTRKQAMEYFAQNRDTGLSKKPSKIQSTNLFDETVYDDILVCEGIQYRLTIEEYNYYLERFEFWNNWYIQINLDYVNFGKDMHYNEWDNYEKSKRLEIAEYKDYYDKMYNK